MKESDASFARGVRRRPVASSRSAAQMRATVLHRMRARRACLFGAACRARMHWHRLHFLQRTRIVCAAPTSRVVTARAAHVRASAVQCCTECASQHRHAVCARMVECFLSHHEVTVHSERCCGADQSRASLLHRCASCLLRYVHARRARGRRLCLRGLLHARLAPVGAHYVRMGLLQHKSDSNHVAPPTSRARVTARAAQMRAVPLCCTDARADASCLCGISHATRSRRRLCCEIAACEAHICRRAHYVRMVEIYCSISYTCRRCARRVRARYSGCMCRR